MYLLLPGRHQLLTNFQVSYLQQIIEQGLGGQTDVSGTPLPFQEPVTAVIVAVTSSNHSNTRRNPLPFHLRAMAIETMGQTLSVPVYVYGIDDVGSRNDFAAYTLKRIQHESDGLHHCTPNNTVVICSTPVLQLYEQIGYRILPAELANRATWQYKAVLPWDVVEKIASLQNDWYSDDFVQQRMHPAALELWKKYQLGKKVQVLFKDAMISSDGDLTTTRDYNVYVRQMDDIAALKYQDTAQYVQPGRIGDIGCAVGSWLKLAAQDERFRESDLYGIEVSRHLFEICRQRKENGEFINPFVFFSQKNAVTGLVFDKGSMNTIHTSSLTHEIESYGSRQDLLHFIQNRFEELAPGGVWVNRDVVGPTNQTQTVLAWFNSEDGSNNDPLKDCADSHELSNHLLQLSTHARFIRFARDFRQAEGYALPWQPVQQDGKNLVQLSLQDAMEFLSRKDYTDNWQSEMHETFCYWDEATWKEHLKEVGFRIHPASQAFTNQWIVQHRWEGKAKLFDTNLQPLDWPVTNMILIGVKG